MALFTSKDGKGRVVGAAIALITSPLHNAANVFELQAGASLIGRIRAEADFRPRGMVVLVVFT